MKKNILCLSFMAMVLCSFILASCSDDDDEVNVNAQELCGKWDPVRAEGWEKEDGRVTDSWNEDLTTTQYNGYTRMQFDEDGTAIEYAFGSNGWNNVSSTGTWSGNKIHLDNSGEDITIKGLSSTTLVIEYREKEDWGEFYEKVTYKKVEE